MIKLIYLLILFIFVCYSANAQEIIVKESIGNNGNKIIKYRIKEKTFNSIRMVEIDSNNNVIDDISLIGEESIAEISISINGAIVSKTFGDFDIGYSLDKNNKIKTITVINKINHEIVAGYILKYNIYEKITDAEYKDLKVFSVMDLLK